MASVNKYCVYTCVTGNYDALLKIKAIDKKYDYICFTNKPELLIKKKIGIWVVRELEYNMLDPVRNARWHKILGYKLLSSYDSSIYIDANVNILTHQIYDAVANTNKTLLIPSHYIRTCIFQEIDACQRMKLEDHNMLFKVHDLLIKNNMPHNYGLNETNLIYRKHHSSNIDKIMEEWWYYIENYSKRDQLSLSYVLWRANVGIIDISIPNIRIDKKNYAVYRHLNDFGLFYLFVVIDLMISSAYYPYKILHVLIFLNNLELKKKMWLSESKKSLNTFVYSHFFHKMYHKA